MGYIVKMPKLGLEMEQGTLLEWTIDVGTEVTEGEKIAEVESEKSVGEVEAREDGVLRKQYLEAGAAVPPGAPIGIFAAADADISDLEAEAELEDGDDTTDAEPESEPEATGSETQTASEADGGGTSASAAGSNIKASPRAKKRAEELGVELIGIDGTGPQNSITEADVESAAEEAESTKKAESEQIRASPRARARAEELGVELTGIDGTGPQNSITEADVEAAATERTGQTAGVRRIEPETGGEYRYDRVTAVADPEAGAAILETTEAVRSAFEQRVEITDVLVVVASATLSDCPVLNGTYAESTHHLQNEQNIALVTEADEEPVAGVIPRVEDLSVTEIVERRQELEAEDGRRPSFSITNRADTDFDSPLVNPPGVASLDVDPTGQRAVPSEDGVDLQPLVTAGVTYDTRAIDTADAERFLERFFERATEAGDLVIGSYRGDE
ncbi:MAG: E3 binding domain-containing protein [Natronomonas sp.]